MSSFAVRCLSCCFPCLQSERIDHQRVGVNSDSSNSNRSSISLGASSSDNDSIEVEIRREGSLSAAQFALNFPIGEASSPIPQAAISPQPRERGEVNARMAEIALAHIYPRDVLDFQSPAPSEGSRGSAGASPVPENFVPFSGNQMYG